MSQKRVILIFCYLWISYVTAGNVMDRNNNQTQEKDVCYSSLYKIYCNVKCGTKIGLCVEKLCYCVYALRASRRSDGPSMIFIARPEDLYDESHSGLGVHQVYGKKVIELSPQPSSDLSTFPMRPALRHHIAHFCPNLEVAKECIRTCMKEGKPAFCGKDHVCYCGHKYNSRDKTSNENLAETYGEFHDMYEKYFGTHNFGEKSRF